MGLFKRQGDLCLDILAPHLEPCACPSAASVSKQALEEITKPARTALSAEDVAKVTKLNPRILPPGGRCKVGSRFPVRPKLIISLALLRIGQHFIGFVYLFGFTSG